MLATLLLRRVAALFLLLLCTHTHADTQSFIHRHALTLILVYLVIFRLCCCRHKACNGVGIAACCLGRQQRRRWRRLRAATDKKLSVLFSSINWSNARRIELVRFTLSLSYQHCRRWQRQRQRQRQWQWQRSNRRYAVWRII